MFGDRGQRLHPAMHRALMSTLTISTLEERWVEELMAGIVSSADTGNEDLVIAARAALCDFCVTPSTISLVCSALVRNLRAHQGNDRVLVPTLEVVAFLFHVGVFGMCTSVDLKALCLLVQKAGYKTGNVRKIEACIRVYGALALQGLAEARKRLGALLFHPWPRVRSMVVDELWGLLSGDLGADPDPAPVSSLVTATATATATATPQRLLGVDWGVAGKAQVKQLVEELGLV